MRNSKIQWYQIPVGLGIGFLGLVQFYKVSAREQEKREREDGLEGTRTPKKRPRIRPDGPWCVIQWLFFLLMATPIPTRLRLTELQASPGHVNAASQGHLSSMGKIQRAHHPLLSACSWLQTLLVRLWRQVSPPRKPVPQPLPCILTALQSLDEVAEPDLHVYPNLASFFYRTLKPGARPLDPNPHTLLCPSDGKVLQYGQIQGGDIEQVKGMTYSIDALLGKNTPAASIASGTPSESGQATPQTSGDEEVIRQEEEFAQVNGISYTLPDLLSGAGKHSKVTDESMPASPGTVSEVRAELALGERPWYDLLSEDQNTSLYYAVIYLAPGDYHRFHSPTNWVVDRRRHFAGELFSVSPYLQRTLPGLFTLNERVVLLGRWRWGFFSYVPVGATNVGSIKINFDRELRTNSLLTDTAADLAADEAAERGEPYLGFAEATYEAASPVLRGHALRRGEEMGGFQLGSTVVLIFEAPAETKGKNKEPKGWAWAVEKGQTVKMGEALGRVIE